MIEFQFSKYAQKQLMGLDKGLQLRIESKLKMLKNHPDIFSILVLMQDSDYSTHRLRIGNYRLLIKLQIQQKDYLHFIILKIGHRKDVYQ